MSVSRSDVGASAPLRYASSSDVRTLRRLRVSATMRLLAVTVRMASTFSSMACARIMVIASPISLFSLFGSGWPPLSETCLRYISARVRPWVASSPPTVKERRYLCSPCGVSMPNEPSMRPPVLIARIFQHILCRLRSALMRHVFGKRFIALRLLNPAQHNRQGRRRRRRSEVDWQRSSVCWRARVIAHSGISFRALSRIGERIAS